MNRMDGRSHSHKAVYGAMGTPVQHELEKLLSLIEGGTHTQVVNSGLSACTTPLLAFLGQGDHLLLPDSVYGPTRRFADTMLKRMGISTTYYAPMATRAEIEALIRAETRIILAESPGSHTFEVQDVPMLADVAHQADALLFLDNTWGIGVFQPFEHGVDVSIQALTKYPGGHSDVIIGSITVNDETHWKTHDDAISRQKKAMSDMMGHGQPDRGRNPDQRCSDGKDSHESCDPGQENGRWDTCDHKANPGQDALNDGRAEHAVHRATNGPTNDIDEPWCSAWASNASNEGRNGHAKGVAVQPEEECDEQRHDQLNETAG